MDIDISNPPDFEGVPVDAYSDVMPDEEDFSLTEFDIGVMEIPVVSEVPLPEATRKEYKPRAKRETSPDHEFVPEVLQIPEGLSKTVVGKLARVVHQKIEFPEVSAFFSLLASASCSVSCAFATQYATASPVALGMYAIIEQPPAMMKSYLLDIGMAPYRMAIGDHNKKIAAKNHEMKERQVEGFVPMLRAFGETSDGTSASIDGFLSKCSEGRYVVSSAEQAGLQSLFPEGMFSSNNELLLKGYVGEYVSGMRSTRKAFEGQIRGSVVIIAQPGSSKRVLTASGGSGLAERFIYVAEPDPIGYRRNEGKFPTPAEKQPFELACTKCVQMYSSEILAGSGADPSERVVMDAVNLIRVRASDEGYAAIKRVKDGNEPYLLELKLAGEMVMMGWLAKIETHVLKVAANIHVIECIASNCKVADVIPTWIVEESLDLVNSLADHIKEIMNKAGESGSEAEEETIIETLARCGMSKRALVLSAKNKKPFRSMPGAYKIASARVESMLASGALVVSAAGRIEIV